MSLQKPVYVSTMFNGKVTVIVFGAPFNWNYAGSSQEEMEAKNPGISNVIQTVRHVYGIKRALVPKPAFNAQVVTESDLTQELIPGFFRGADADGVILTQPGDAYFLASADCLAAAIYDDRTGALAALHCGRDALIDRKNIDDPTTTRDYSSVIHSAVDRLNAIDRLSPVAPLNTDIDLSNPAVHRSVGESKVFLAAGIASDTFTHPTVDHPYADANRRMVSYLIKYFPGTVTDEFRGNIDLFALVRDQLSMYDITNVEDDGFDTATSKGADGNFLFHSNRRDKTLRNLVVIKLN